MDENHENYFADEVVDSDESGGFDLSFPISEISLSKECANKTVVKPSLVEDNPPDCSEKLYACIADIKKIYYEEKNKLVKLLLFPSSIERQNVSYYVRLSDDKTINALLVTHLNDISKVKGQKLSNQINVPLNYNEYTHWNQNSINYFRRTSFCEVQKIIKELKSKKSPGYDNIRAETLKEINTFFADLAIILCLWKKEYKKLHVKNSPYVKCAQNFENSLQKQASTKVECLDRSHRKQAYSYPCFTDKSSTLNKHLNQLNDHMISAVKSIDSYIKTYGTNRMVNLTTITIGVLVRSLPRRNSVGTALSATSFMLSLSKGKIQFLRETDTRWNRFVKIFPASQRFFSKSCFRFSSGKSITGRRELHIIKRRVVYEFTRKTLFLGWKTKSEILISWLSAKLLRTSWSFVRGSNEEK
nr:unnamed protein product [Callosobruchus analis]